MFAPRSFARRGEESELEAGRQARPLSGLNFADVSLFPPVQPKLAGDRATGGHEHAEAASSQRRLGLNAPRSEPVQAKPEPNRTGMPDRLKGGIESLSGIDMSDVRVHANSDRPARVNALAYTQGNQIYMGPGQERHLAHEAWHAVQQKQRRVRATGEMKGEGINDDAGLEREADWMGARGLLAGGANRYVGHDQAKSSSPPFPIDYAIFQCLHESEPIFQFMENRPKVIAQRPLKKIVSNSLKAKQSTVFQQVSNHLSNRQPPIQAYAKKSVAYSSPEAKRAKDHREEMKNWNAGPNAGSIYTEDGYENVQLSSGTELHSEKLLIGTALKAKNEKEEDYLKFHNYIISSPNKQETFHYGKTELFTEREPCPPCHDILQKAFNEDDTVYYTVPYADSKTMTAQLEIEIADFFQMKTLHEIEEEEYGEKQEVLINIVLKQFEDAKLMETEDVAPGTYTSQLIEIINSIKKYKTTELLGNFEEIKSFITNELVQVMERIKGQHSEIQSKLISDKQEEQSSQVWAAEEKPPNKRPRK